MTVIFALGAMLIAQASPAILSGNEVQQRDVAYEQLANGEAENAIARLEAIRSENPDDPALLINLGSAYAKIGNVERAAELYRAAIASDVRYRLELANGEWVDSRNAARMALRTLEGSELALK